MDTKNAVSITINQNNLRFIESVAKSERRSRSEVIDRILGMYRKFKLKNDIITGFKSQTQEDIEDVMSDFGDYLSIVDR